VTPMPEGETQPDLRSIMVSRRYGALLALAAVVGVVASFAAWCFLEVIHEAQVGIYTDLPDALGYDSAPQWWPLPFLTIAGVIVAFAIERLPGTGGHIPAHGLDPAPTQPIELAGVVLAALAGISAGVVLGPEAPLIALGGGLGYFFIRRLGSGAPTETESVVAASGTFAAISFLFGSPLVAAVLLVEAAGLGGPRLPLVLIPGLMAAGIGTLVETGMGSWTGVETSDISLGVLPVSDFPRPDLVEFLWTIPLSIAIAIGVFACFELGRRTVPIVKPRPFVFLPAIGIIVGGLAIVFSEATDKTFNHVLFSGQEELNPLVAQTATWSVSALALLIGFKAVAYGLSLGSFRGGPVFPAILLAVAGGLMAAHLPGYSVTPAVAVAVGAGTVAALRLPLSAVVLATVLTSPAGLGVAPLIVVGVTVAYLTTLALYPSPRAPGEPAPR
jgi:H+/Cl- antiporter ClcA